jgi:succinate dehydrogenase/fumarate reductase flavoprotein subunit
MKKSAFAIGGTRFPLYSLNTLIIGSGTAALAAALRLHDYGQTDIAIATEDFGGGTSNNAGSDKQTYYKLSLAGGHADSPYEMARDLFDGGGMHGDIALCEALGSAEAFFHLVGLGVPFPRDRYGAYVGYKTDHDPKQRATSAGPLTSRLMFEALAREVKKKRIKIFDGHPVIALLTDGTGDDKNVIGAIALDKTRCQRGRPGFVVFNAVNIVLGTGGPAGLYETSVYPESQTGSHGLAFEIGAVGNNLTESQFGLASLKFRWNLSGTYQQVIPRYVSTERDGRDEREFLNEAFPDMGTLATAIFLKGYQWPFDPRKIAGHGSSLIDLLVHRETAVKGRRVFLDFRRNPGGAGKLRDFSLATLRPEALSYLQKSNALQATPIERLKNMNPPAVDIYKSHGIDLEKEILEIAVCAQHNNGGLKGDVWWESNIKHLFPVGEANGTHGVYRPGGSALNAGQVGGMRAALFIAKRYAAKPPRERDFLARAGSRVREKLDAARGMLGRGARTATALPKARAELRKRMSAAGAHIRNPEEIGRAVESAWKQHARLTKSLSVPGARDLPEAFKTLDLCLTQALYLEAIKEYLEKGGKSRGSFLVLDPNGEKPCPELDDSWKFLVESRESFVSRKILEISLDEKMNVRKHWADIRPIPSDEAWFENVWNDFRNDRIVRSQGREK